MLGMCAPVARRWKSAALAESTRFSTVSRFSLALPAPAPPLAEPMVTAFSALQSNEMSSMAFLEEKVASNVSPSTAGPGAPAVCTARK
jgi:hypothetical protein